MQTIELRSGNLFYKQITVLYYTGQAVLQQMCGRNLDNVFFIFCIIVSYA